MSTAGRTAAEHADAASDVTRSLRSASFTHLVAHADGGALAATGLLARALADAGRPFQVSVVRTRDEASRRVADAGDDTCVTLGVESSDAAASVGPDGAASVVAYAAARELTSTPEPALALAGAVAGGVDPGDAVRDGAHSRGIERRPGVGIPTENLADGLAHTTLVRASFSGDVDATQAALAELNLPMELDDDARRSVASLLALDATGGNGVPPRAAVAIERGLRPHALPDGPFATVEGFADVLEAVARDESGTAVALALGHDARTAALETWRTHAAAVHRALGRIEPTRHRGVVVANVDDAPVWSTARLLRDFVSPEPVAVVVGDGEAAVAGSGDVDVAGALAAADGTGAVGGGATHAYARLDDVAVEEFVENLRGEL